MADRGLIGRLRSRAGAGRMPATPAAAEQEVQAPPRSPDSQWFWDHYDGAAAQIVDAFAQAGISMNDLAVADVGCGDGIMDLGLLGKARPRSLTGFDLNLTDTEYLRRRAGEEGVAEQDWERLVFERSEPGRIPAPDASFDLAFSWSAFEHISQPVEVLSEIRRIIAPNGAFFLQLWPFYHSAKGSHLWDWFPQDFHHLQQAESDIAEQLAASTVKPADWTQMMSWEFQHLNRITVEELQRSMLAAGFVVRRLEFIASPVALTPELARYSWLDLGIGGIKLIATPS